MAKKFYRLEKMNILLTCAGRRNYIVDYFREALREIGGKVFAANSTEYSTALIASELGFVLPSIYDPNYIEVILKICQEFNINAVVSLFDLELPILAQARDRFTEKNIFLVLSPEEIIEICNDKWLTNIFLKEIGVLVPDTYQDIHAVEEAIKSRNINFPIIIKPRWGMGSIGLMEAENIEELYVLYSKAIRAIENSYLSTLSHRDINKAVLFQEKLNGQEFGLDVINNLEGKFIACVVKKKISMRSGETDVAMTVDDMSLRMLGERIGTKLGHLANLDVDVFKTDTGTYVLEMNPRFGGGYPFSHLAGVNLPKAIISWLQGLEPDQDCFNITYGIIGLKGVQLFSFEDGNFQKLSCLD